MRPRHAGRDDRCTRSIAERGQQLPRNRVFLMGMPTMLSNLVRSCVDADAQLELVGESDAADLATAITARPDCIVTSLRALADTPSDLAEVMRTGRPLRILGIEATNGTGELFELRPHRTRLGELGLASLGEALRGTGGDD
jgi:hypothetical protein